MNPSAIREILKLTERPGILNFAGGLPSPETFPVDAMRAACATVLAEGSPIAHPALQYAASEGLPELRQWVATELGRQGAPVSPEQVLITTGSQQGLDLVAKVLLDAGAPLLVETPTYLGALQAFTPMQPAIRSVASDDEGVQPEALRAQLEQMRGEPPRFMYLLPNFQNPTGRTMPEARRQAVLDLCRAHGLPIVEDNPYGELWFDAPPPAPLLARWPEGVIYLGSFSKILAPGLRLGYLVAPPALYPKLLQAKQAADLHTPGFNQRVVVEVIKDGFLDRHVPTIRARYKAQRDAMMAALTQHMAGLDVRWNAPVGGMFVWLRLPDDGKGGLDAQALLPKAVEAGMAFVPGAPFYAAKPDARTLRLSFVTATPAQIERGMAALGQVVRAAL